ncbi:MULTISPECIES: LacI family DNA-binding transcriptional regulator [unclassified Duganella]|uniref:LacI family DNA-binding transcriptional regulator n=1 Tax=unclassified Duganella TaxID=2636909 RepID=UPI000E3495D3|nr:MULTISPECIES: LacI family DNA-binding transcriptional regulator [unclassified Duganella]RFP18712.1 LacI family transcriptional regulator [Duganella sp. BJB475]RFP35377.1 LacI family transcriptional regulator [Duganella sp. BJB476]
MKQKSVTLVQVAAKAGVSVMTASRAISGEGYVSDDTRAKVQAAVAELGYATNTLARMMKGGRTNVIGVVVNDLASVVVNAFVSALTEEVRKYQMDMFIYNSIDDLDQQAGRRHRDLLHGLWDGLIYVLPRMSDDYLATLEASPSPIVLVNFCRRETSLPVVLGDNYNGARDAVASLVGLGHQRIAFIRGTHFSGQSAERERGYRQAMHDAGLAIDERWVMKGTFSELSGLEAGRALLALDQRPTAIFAANDEMAIGCMNALRAADVAVPGEISLVGFDDVQAASLVQPRLTTLRHPIAQMAQAAVQELMRRIQQQPGLRQRIEFPSELVIRESAGAAPQVAAARVSRSRKTAGS